MMRFCGGSDNGDGCGGRDSGGKGELTLARSPVEGPASPAETTPSGLSGDGLAVLVVLEEKPRGSAVSGEHLRGAPSTTVSEVVHEGGGSDARWQPG